MPPGWTAGSTEERDKGCKDLVASPELHAVYTKSPDSSRGPFAAFFLTRQMRAWNLKLMVSLSYSIGGPMEHFWDFSHY